MTTNTEATALVTGASTGIGRATAIALKDAGFRVFGTSRRAVAASPEGITMLICDVTDDASVAKMVDEVLTQTGRIDLLVNNAGMVCSAVQKNPRSRKRGRCSTSTSSVSSV